MEIEEEEEEEETVWLGDSSLQSVRSPPFSLLSGNGSSPRLLVSFVDLRNNQHSSHCQPAAVWHRAPRSRWTQAGLL